MSLQETVPLGYTLSKPIRLAIQQGIIPVVLTGRFLENMTHSGFFWLPGVKFKHGKHSGDIDLLACCDGLLVFCECKQLENIPPDAKVWDDVVEQFLKTSEVAQRCGANLVVLSSKADQYPQGVRDRISEMLGTTIPFLLLDRSDLEASHRKIEREGNKFSLSFHDILPLQFPEPPGKPRPGNRSINMGWGAFTRCIQ